MMIGIFDEERVVTHLERPQLLAVCNGANRPCSDYAEGVSILCRVPVLQALTKMLVAQVLNCFRHVVIGI